MNTRALRQKILDLAIHGKLVPQDPSDEPASVLLERIHAEKERLIKEGKIKKPAKSKATCDKPPYPYQLPEGWVWTTVGDVCSKIGSGSTPKGSNYSKTGIPFFRSQNIFNTGIVLSDIKYISDEVHQSMIGTEVIANDLLLNITGGSLGRCAIVPENFNKGNVSQHVCILRAILVRPKYFHAFILSSFFIKNMKITGSGREGLPKYNLEKMFLPLPPLNEQDKIIDEVDKFLSFINTLESSEDNLTKLIYDAKSQILDLAVHGKLVPQDPSDEPASELLKRINPKAEITCGTPRYGKLPKGWCICHIPDIAKSLLGKTLDHSKNTGITKGYLCAINVLWGKFDFTTQKTFLLEENEYERYAVKKGDLMVCEGGDVGRCAIWEDDSKEMYYQNALHRIRCKEGVFNYYIQFLLWHYKLNGTIDYLCKGVTIKHFTQTVMNKLDILLPPFEEQKRIVAKIEELFAQLDKIEASL